VCRSHSLNPPRKSFRVCIHGPLGIRTTAPNSASRESCSAEFERRLQCSPHSHGGAPEMTTIPLHQPSRDRWDSSRLQHADHLTTSGITVLPFNLRRLRGIRRSIKCQRADRVPRLLPRLMSVLGTNLSGKPIRRPVKFLCLPSSTTAPHCEWPADHMMFVSPTQVNAQMPALASGQRLADHAHARRSEQYIPVDRAVRFPRVFLSGSAATRPIYRPSSAGQWPGGHPPPIRCTAGDILVMYLTGWVR